MEDNEGEVRKAICLNMDNFFTNLGKDDQNEKILKQFKRVEKDNQQFVKLSFASTFLKVSGIVGKAKTNEHILPVFINFIKEDNPELKIAALNTVDKLHEVFYY